jgi:hypothetical protein
MGIKGYNAETLNVTHELARAEFQRKEEEANPSQGERARKRKVFCNVIIKVCVEIFFKILKN